MKSIILCLSICVFLTSAFSHEALAKKKEEFKFGGRLGLGINQTNSPADESAGAAPDFEMRLQASSPRKKRFKGVVEIRAGEGNRNVNINDAFVDWRNKEKTSRVRFGRGKKILGWEYEYPTAARLSISRSKPYQYLGERNFVGRDYFISKVWIKKADQTSVAVVEDAEAVSDENDANAPDAAGAEEEKSPRDMQTLIDSSWFDPSNLIDAEQRWKYELAGHFNEMKDISVIGSAIFTPNAQYRFGGWLTVGRTQAGSGVQGSWAATLSGLYQNHIHRIGLEVFGGTDTYRNEITMVYGDQTSYKFAAMKAEYGLYLSEWNPYAVGSYLVKDWKQLGDRTLEGIFGLRYFFEATLNIAVEGSLISAVSHTDPTSSGYSESQAKVMARYFF